MEYYYFQISKTVFRNLHWFSFKIFQFKLFLHSNNFIQFQINCKMTLGIVSIFSQYIISQVFNTLIIYNTRYTLHHALYVRTMGVVT